MARRPHEREAAVQGGLDRGAGREGCRLERRRGAGGVGVEQRRGREAPDVLYVLGRMTQAQVVLGRSPPLGPALEVVEQDGEARRPFRVGPGRVQARERRVRQDVDRTVSSSASSGVPFARASPTR
jgi:hypothetical protein